MNKQERREAKIAMRAHEDAFSAVMKAAREGGQDMEAWGHVVAKARKAVAVDHARMYEP